MLLGLFNQAYHELVGNSMITKRLANIYVHQIGALARRIIGRRKLIASTDCSAATFSAIKRSDKGNV